MDLTFWRLAVFCISSTASGIYIWVRRSGPLEMTGVRSFNRRCYTGFGRVERHRDRLEVVATLWIEPYSNRELGVADGAESPEARYERHEALELAFIAALQNLPPVSWLMPVEPSPRLRYLGERSAGARLLQARST